MGAYITLSEAKEHLVVDAAYTGDDQYFDFRRQLEDWLPQNYRRFDVSQYQYNYTQYAGEITLTYGDYADFRRVNDDDEVAAALEQNGLHVIARREKNDWVSLAAAGK